MKFSDLKKEIKARALNNVSDERYAKISETKNYEQLINLIMDNFFYYAERGIINGKIIDAYQSKFSDYNVYHNKSTGDGFLIADKGESTVWGTTKVYAVGVADINALGFVTVQACGSTRITAHEYATIEAFGSDFVNCWGESYVRAFGWSIIRASEKSKVRAYGYSNVISENDIDCEIYENAVHRIVDENTIQYNDSVTRIK